MADKIDIPTTVLYKGQVNEVRKIAEFDSWISRLRDGQGRARIFDRLLRLGDGNFGDAKSVGFGVQELRMHFGPGYRVYFARHGEVIILLLIGGDKSSQSRDIAKAIELARYDHGIEDDTVRSG